MTSVTPSSSICITGKADAADNGLMVQLRGFLAQQLAVLVAVEESVHGCLPFLLSELPRICDSSNVAQEVRDGKAIQCVEAFGCHL